MSACVTAERKRGRPARALSWTPAEVAAAAGIDEARIVRACEARVLPHARQVNGAWSIPAADVARVVFGGRGIQQLYTLQEFAELIGFSYSFVHKATKRSVDGIKTLEVFGQPRIPASEYWRITGQQPSA